MKFIRKHQERNIFLIKLRGISRNLIKKETSAQAHSCEFRNFFLQHRYYRAASDGHFWIKNSSWNKKLFAFFFLFLCQAKITLFIYLLIKQQGDNIKDFIVVELSQHICCKLILHSNFINVFACTIRWLLCSILFRYCPLLLP